MKQPQVKAEKWTILVLSFVSFDPVVLNKQIVLNKQSWFHRSYENNAGCITGVRYKVRCLGAKIKIRIFRQTYKWNLFSELVTWQSFKCEGTQVMIFVTFSLNGHIFATKQHKSGQKRICNKMRQNNINQVWILHCKELFSIQKGINLNQVLVFSISLVKICLVQLTALVLAWVILSCIVVFLVWFGNL